MAVNNGSFNERNMEHANVSDTLHTSSDPAKFVLDFILWLSTEQKKTGGSGFEGSALRSYILLLEQLKEVSPRISPQVKVAAATLAVEWMNKIVSVTANSLEVFGCLQFLSIYGIVSFFRREEILQLLMCVAQHKMAPETCRALGFSSMFPDIVRNLYQRMHYSEATKFLYSFKLMNKAPPEASSTLQEFLERIRLFAYRIHTQARTNAQDNALDFEVAALRILINLVEDHELESLLPTRSIERCIVQLGNMKANSNQHQTAILYPVFELELQLRQNCNAGIS